MLDRSGPYCAVAAGADCARGRPAPASPPSPLRHAAQHNADCSLDAGALARGIAAPDPELVRAVLIVAHDRAHLTASWSIASPDSDVDAERDTATLQAPRTLELPASRMPMAYDPFKVWGRLVPHPAT